MLSRFRREGSGLADVLERFTGPGSPAIAFLIPAFIIFLFRVCLLVLVPSPGNLTSRM